MFYYGETFVMIRIKYSALPVLMAALAAGHVSTRAPLDAQSSSSEEAEPEGPRAGQIPSQSESELPASKMRTMIERYSVDRGSLSRAYPIEPSPGRHARFKQFYSEWRTTLGRLDFDALALDDRVDYLLFKNQLDYELHQLEVQEKSLAETETLVPFARNILHLEETRRRMERIDPQKMAALLTELNKQIEATFRRVEAGLPSGRRSASESPAEGDGKAGPLKPKKPLANRAAITVNSLRNMLRSWFGFYNGYDPVFTWWVETPYKTVDKTLQDYAALLRERVLGLRPGSEEAGDDMAAGVTVRRGSQAAGANQFRGEPTGRTLRVGVQAEAGSSTDVIGDPIGRDVLMSELAREMIPYDPEELIALANKELAWCEDQMRKASRELGYGDDWMKALEHVKTLYVEPGKQPELIRDLALEAIKFVEDHDLITVPPLARETWRMEMMSPERQLVNPFFTGGETISVSYPTNTMSHEQKMMSMRGNNIPFSRATVHHELIPGHHLQGFMTARYRPYRAPFSTPFWGEGWALYWELLLWDMDFPKTPENKIGMLFWRMHRCARIIFSLSFHLERMTPQECIDFLVKRVGHEQENATAEVRRSFNGSYSPLYQAAYLLGGLQFYALHKELVESGRMSNRAFHDAILKENRIPVEMVRALLTRQPLTRDYASSWKFYGPVPRGR